MPNVMLQMVHKKSQRDHNLFIKHIKGGNLTILLVYFDDIIVTGNDKTGKEGLRDYLTCELSSNSWEK